LSKGDAVIDSLTRALRARGYSVDLNVGQSKFRCDLAVRSNSDSLYQLGILVDTDGHYANPNLLDRYLMQPAILRAFGWRFALVLTKDWYHNPDDVLARIEKILQGAETATDSEPEAEEPAEPTPIVPEKADQPAPSAPPTMPTVVAPPPIPIAAANAGSSRRFEFIGGGSQKFWEISIAGKSFAVRFGRIGTAGQSQTKSFADEEKAKREAEKLIAEKVKKGYVEKA
jgi:predicted DNA-binding WGR domain protein